MYILKLVVSSTRGGFTKFVAFANIDPNIRVHRRLIKNISEKVMQLLHKSISNEIFRSIASEIEWACRKS